VEAFHHAAEPTTRQLAIRVDGQQRAVDAAFASHNEVHHLENVARELVAEEITRRLQEHNEWRAQIQQNEQNYLHVEVFNAKYDLIEQRLRTMDSSMNDRIENVERRILAMETRLLTLIGVAAVFVGGLELVLHLFGH